MIFRKKINLGITPKSAKLTNSTNDAILEPSLDSYDDYQTQSNTDTKFSPSASKTTQLIEELQKVDGQIIKPFVDFNEGNLFYPFLSKIGLVQDDISFLDNLVTEGILEKRVFEKLVVCPIHSNTYSSSVRLYCPNCHSISVEKLNLYEHKNCGYISDSTNFDFKELDKSKCPSCKKPIKNFDKEIRVPAMWFQCNDCSEKFDNIDIKLHCRKYEHDFDTNSAQFVATYSYVLVANDYSINSDTSQIKYELVTMLNGFNFDTEINSSVMGKSGNSHKIPLLGLHQKSGERILVYVITPDGPFDESTINSVLVSILDIEPKNTLLITRSEVSDSIHAMAKKYNIDIISHLDFSQIMSHAEAFLSNMTSKGVANGQ